MELYDYGQDPLETVNLAAHPEHREVLEDLKDRLMGLFKSYEQ